MSERWDCHQHRDELQVSNLNTVYHLEHGQLCVTYRQWDCILREPLRFKTKAAACKWVESGCVAELQESLSHLGIGFSKVLFERLPDPYSDLFDED